MKVLPVGTRLQCGSVLLEVTQIGKDCHSHCTIYYQMGKCIMPSNGIFARVLQEGEISVRDTIQVLPETGKEPFRAAVITLFIIYWNRRICSANGGLPPMTKRKKYYESLGQVA